MAEYWENHYKKGNISGLGSIDPYKDWKWSIINIYGDIETKSVVDLGCGDLNFWHDHKCYYYIGIDISPTVIDLNVESINYGRVISKKKPLFAKGNSSNISFDIHVNYAFCFDVLFHLLVFNDFYFTLVNLAKMSTDLIFLNNWRFNPLKRRYKIGKRITQNEYQIYRNLEQYFHIFSEMNFDLIDKINYNSEDPNTMYVFQKM